ncbi:GNAT family N-acetyltransferase [Fusibacter bizertensis]
MFKAHIMQYYQFLTTEEYIDNLKIFYRKECTPSLYEFGEINWIILPERLRNSATVNIDNIEKLDTTVVSFLNKKKYTVIDNKAFCRRLTEVDKELFDQLLAELTEEEKEKGAVSLDDPVIYGLIKENKIVSAASLWHFGDTLSDIGVLTHPDYRNCGYAENVCKYMIENEDRDYIWRSANNPSSKKLSEKLGFIETGAIHSLNI